MNKPRFLKKKYIIEFTKKFYYRASFFPGVVGLFINPFYFSRKDLAVHMLNFGRYITGKTLDIGCGGRHYEPLCNSKKYIGIEIDSEDNRRTKKADFYYDGNILPFKDNFFDSIISNQVFEHVFNPNLFMTEAYRVLKPGGMMLLTAPFMWDEHEQPFDFARYTSFGLQSILEKNGFEIIEFRKSVDDVRAIIQMLCCYIQNIIYTNNKFLNILLIIIFISPLNVLGQFIFFLTPKNPDLYLNNIFLVKKIKR